MCQSEFSGTQFNTGMLINVQIQYNLCHCQLWRLKYSKFPSNIQYIIGWCAFQWMDHDEQNKHESWQEKRHIKVVQFVILLTHKCTANKLGSDIRLCAWNFLVWASSEGSVETVRMLRLAWAFTVRLCDKCPFLMIWLTFTWCALPFRILLYYLHFFFTTRSLHHVRKACVPEYLKSFLTCKLQAYIGVIFASCFPHNIRKEGGNTWVNFLFICLDSGGEFEYAMRDGQ